MRSISARVFAFIGFVCAAWYVALGWAITDEVLKQDEVGA